VRIPLTGEDEMVWVGDDAPPSDTASGFTARRIAAGTPWFGTELRTDTIPVEAAVWDWLSNRKGCYVGQEVVERMWSRNRTARRLCTFALADSALPEAPVEVAGNGGKGQITSIAAHPQRGVIGLGWWTGELVDAQAIDPEGRVWAIQERARDERLVS
jgi:aminomethyltransferase